MKRPYVHTIFSFWEKIEFSEIKSFNFEVKESDWESESGTESEYARGSVILNLLDSI